MSAERPVLHALSERLGILEVYRNVEGHDQATSDASREALVAAMGFEAADEAAAGRALDSLDRAARERLVEPVLVWREWADALPRLQVQGSALGAAREYRIEVVQEDGRAESASGRLPEAGRESAIELPLPLHPPTGYHDVRLTVDGPDGERRVEQRLIMTPRTALQPEEVLGEGPAFGIWANLYSVRAPGDWGHGGLRELARLGERTGELGGSFVGINPLHAVANRGLEFSPYSPTSRLYRNVLYLDPESVPELAQSVEARALLGDASLRRRRAALEESDSIEHEAVHDAMLPVLRALHATFVQAAPPARRQAYADYRAREGRALRDLATWEALAAYHADSCGFPGTAWWRWPEPYRRPDGPAVEAFREAHASEVDFRCWLQFELDRQLGAAADALRAAGCGLGIYQDLALGSSRSSADAWMAPDLFALQAHVGAPPDAYAPEGQDWGFPPFDPHRLRAAAYEPWSQLLRAAFAHTGVLRIDHAMGLMRLFWIPQGRPGVPGAYVSYPATDLLGILALESRRQRSVVVAEDLGTLPPGLPGLLEDWGLLRSSVVYFERDGDRFRGTSRYAPRALTAVATHDLAPFAGYFEGVDLELRRQAGGFASDPDFEAARAARATERAALVEALRAESFLADPEPDDRTLHDAVLAFLAATPCVLASVSLDDLAGERVPVNLPGIPLTVHRSWSRRMSRSLEEILHSPAFRSSLRAMDARSHKTPREG